MRGAEKERGKEIRGEKGKDKEMGEKQKKYRGQRAKKKNLETEGKAAGKRVY